jgi:hypothetical protein
MLLIVFKHADKERGELIRKRKISSQAAQPASLMCLGQLLLECDKMNELKKT